MLPDWYNNYKKKIDESIVKYLDLYFEKNSKDFGIFNGFGSSSEGHVGEGCNLILKEFSEAVYYATKGGKRIRSVFALEFYLIMSGKKFEEVNFEDDIIKLCVAIEFLHAYSLVHDDLPAMDNDTYRRGELTTWKKYGETDGILVGDLLNSLSFEILGNMENKEVGMELIRRFGQAVGFYGMIGGQVLDLYYEKNSDEVNLEKLIETHNKKTGALITFSIIGGVLLGGSPSLNSLPKGEMRLQKAESLELQKYLDFGREIGLAFQVKDDLLDIEGTFEETGKSVGGEKKGFIHLIGMEKSKEYLQELIANCLENIKDLNSEKLNFLVEYIGNRKK